MLLTWLTWSALLAAAAAAADATPEELLLLESQDSVLPHRLLQLLTETGQLQQRQRRLRQSVGFKPWSGKRSGPVGVVADEPTSGELTDRLDDWQDKRANFKPWTGKRSGFKPWTGKRNVFKPWTGKRGSFKPWTGKRESFKPWTGKRESFKPWTGKRGSFKPWTGKRDGPETWTYKPSEVDCPEDESVEKDVPDNDLVDMLHEVEDYAKRIAARSSVPSKGQVRHIVRQRFKPWSGKRSAQDEDGTIKTDGDIQF
ncbi:uncharacterized protein LOC122375191 [Amphibalanus amphitrite]|uniref:uncharacterized protein LOC122375191 n=1 Tax=Amphibalanus amphitrite TaxID=1232801 RepID=UPI001C90EC8E|nr:uncharacterized protein LOC122375191 [Amphibalanus amphitrite]